jgi:hypothetical protein
MTTQRTYLFMGEVEETLERARIYESSGVASEGAEPYRPTACSCAPGFKAHCFFRSDVCEVEVG